MRINYYQHEIEVPEWANWIAIDESGAVWIYELKPRLCSSHWSSDGGESDYLLPFNLSDWKYSLTCIEGEYMKPDAEQLTLRDQFAMAALSGELASQGGDAGYYSERSFKLLAENSYKIADAMVEARAR